MTVEIAAQDNITVYEYGGDFQGEIHIRLRLTNGYECSIPESFSTEQVHEEITNILTRFNSDDPPTNWHPYEGFEG